jgi:transposase-like protein
VDPSTDTPQVSQGPDWLRISTETAARVAELEREVRELRRANAILKSASAFFAAELDRPSR